MADLREAPPSCCRSTASTSTAGSCWPRRSSTCWTRSAAPAAGRAAGRLRRGARRRARARARARGAARASPGARERELDLLEFELREIEEAAPDEAEERELVGRARAAAPPRGAARGGAGRRGGAGAGGRRGRGGALAAAGGGARRRRRASTPRSTRWPSAGAPWRCEAERPRGRAAPLRRGARRRGGGRGHAGRRGGAPGRARPAGAQARRLDRGGARARRALPRAPRGAGGGRGRARGGRGALEAARAERDRRAQALRERARRGPRRSLPTAVRERLAELAMEGATLRDRAGRARGGAGAVPARTPSSSCIAPERRRARGAAARDRVRRRALARHARAARRRQRRLRRRRSSSTRSTRGSAARPRAPSASSCATLAEGRQVVCITHLPQIASLAARHFSIEKDAARRAGADDGARAGRAARSSASSCGCSARDGRRRRCAAPRARAAARGLRPGAALTAAMPPYTRAPWPSPAAAALGRRDGRDGTRVVGGPARLGRRTKLPRQAASSRATSRSSTTRTSTACRPRT